MIERRFEATDKLPRADGKDPRAVVAKRDPVEATGVYLLVGAVFMYIGVRSVRGTAASTVGYGWCSIVLSFLWLGAGLVVQPIAIISIVVGGSLIAAGILALVGEDGYREWRRGQQDHRGQTA
jgi:hypothetical protein